MAMGLRRFMSAFKLQSRPPVIATLPADTASTRRFDRDVVLTVLQAMPSKREALSFLRRHQTLLNSSHSATATPASVCAIVWYPPPPHQSMDETPLQPMAQCIVYLRRLGLAPMIFIPSMNVNPGAASDVAAQHQHPWRHWSSVVERLLHAQLANCTASLDHCDPAAVSRVLQSGRIPLIGPRQYDATSGTMHPVCHRRLVESAVAALTTASIGGHSAVSKLIVVRPLGGVPSAPLLLLHGNDVSWDSDSSCDADLTMARRCIATTGGGITALLAAPHHTRAIVQHCITGKPPGPSSESTGDNSGCGATVVQRGVDICRVNSLAHVDTGRLAELLELSFQRPLPLANYLRRLAGKDESVRGRTSILHSMLIAGDFDGVAIVTRETATAHDGRKVTIHYLDKFGVAPRTQGSGVVDQLWRELRAMHTNSHTELVWRSRADNGANRWYFERCDGHMRVGPWILFYCHGDTAVHRTGPEWLQRLDVYRDCVAQLPPTFVDR